MKKIISILLAGVILGFCAVGFNDWALERHKEVTAKQYKEMTKTLQQDTVHLLGCKNAKKCWTGTGFVVKTDNNGSWIVTNKHVCMGVFLTKDPINPLGSIGITDYRNNKSGGQIIKLGMNSDLCLIRTELKFKKALELADKSPEKNAKLLSYGFPGSQPTWAQGKFLGTEGYGFSFMTISDMKVYYGASGSAVVNEQGKVIGVVSRITFNPTKGKPQKKDVLNTLIIPLELLREFIGGL